VAEGASLLAVQSPHAGRHLALLLISLRGLRGRIRLDLDAIALADAADTRVHQTGDAILAREDAEVRAHRAAGADDRFEALEDRRRQRAADVVDDRDRVRRHAVVHELQHSLAGADIASDAGGAALVLDVVVADATLLAARAIDRRDDG